MVVALEFRHAAGNQISAETRRLLAEYDLVAPLSRHPGALAARYASSYN